MGKRIDLTGQRFGRLTVIERRGSDKNKKALWLCKCECGNEVVVRGVSLTNGNTKSCGCYNSEKASKRTKDLTGMKFGRLTVVERYGSKNRCATWLCKCECGNEVVVKGIYLKSRETTSCGCSRKAKDITGIKFGRLTVIKECGRDKGGNVRWLCRCECGNKVVVLGKNLRNSRTTSCGCYHKEKASEKGKERIGESNPSWKGGITPISIYLRSLPIVEQWANNCKQQVNYTCKLTGKVSGELNTHHLKAFSTIVLEAHKLYGIKIYETIGEYTQEELHKLEEYVASWHKDNSNAVVLCEEAHILFHSLYGKGNNTKKQFEEFKERYLNGEFNDLLGDDFND